VGASSDEGDLVVDPFCGSGTTLHAARDLGRRYIGMDASFSAAKATIRRMRHGLESMGDYVTKRSKKAGDLDFPLAEDKQNLPCSFMVDSHLLDAYPQE